VRGLGPITVQRLRDRAVVRRDADALTP
jgi:hypothetical protein